MVIMVLEKSKLDNLLKNCVSLGAGSQGEVFLDNNTKQVYKVFHSYFFNEESCFNEYDIRNLVILLTIHLFFH